MQKNKPLPSFFSNKFISYKITSPISDGVKIKFAEGNGTTKTKILADFKSSISDISASYHVITDITWSARVNNNMVYQYYIGDVSILYENKKVLIKGGMNEIYNFEGKLVECDVYISHVSIDGKSISREKYIKYGQKIKQRIPLSGNSMILANIGRKIKTGNEFINSPIRESLKSKHEFEELDPELILRTVAGWSSFNDRKVIVTDIMFNLGSKNDEVEAKIKGYDLVDAETFIRLGGKGAGYLNFIKSGNKMSIEIEWSYETHVDQTYRVFDSFEYQDTVLSVKEKTKMGDLKNKL